MVHSQLQFIRGKLFCPLTVANHYGLRQCIFHAGLSGYWLIRTNLFGTLNQKTIVLTPSRLSGEDIFFPFFEIDLFLVHLRIIHLSSLLHNLEIGNCKPIFLHFKNSPGWSVFLQPFKLQNPFVFYTYRYCFAFLTAHCCWIDLQSCDCRRSEGMRTSRKTWKKWVMLRG